METDKAEQLDILFSQSAKVLKLGYWGDWYLNNFRWNSKSSNHFHLDNQDTHKAIVMAEKERFINQILKSLQEQMHRNQSVTIFP